MRRAKWLLAALFVLAAANAYGGDAVTDLGITKGEPIETGFLFVDGKYIDAPYVVERRGVSIYINNIMISPGPEYPPYDYRVETDPGDDPPADMFPTEPPPPGVDGRDMYWSRKARYLFQHYDEDTAREMLVEAYRKSPKVKEIIRRADDPIRVTLVEETGESHSVALWIPYTYLQPPPTQDEILKWMEDSRLSYEKLLKGETTVVLRYGKGLGTEVVFRGEKGLKFIEDLLSAKTLDERVAALGSAVESLTSDKSAREALSRFEASPELAERYQAAKAKWDTRKSRPDWQTWD